MATCSYPRTDRLSRRAAAQEHAEVTQRSRLASRHDRPAPSQGGPSADSGHRAGNFYGKRAGARGGYQGKEAPAVTAGRRPPRL